MAKNELNASFAEELSQKDLDAFEQQGWVSKTELPILTLEIGESIRGMYTEKGTYTVYDKQTKANKDLNTYTIENEKGAVRLGGKMTLDKAMATVAVGSQVIITRKPAIETKGGNKLPVYHVLAKK